MLKKKNKLILRYLIWALVVFIFILSSLFAYIYINRNKIKEILIEEINSNVLVEIKVDDIEMSLFKNFPYISLIFHKLQIPEIVNGKALETNFIEADKVYLQFSIIDILKSNYTLRKIRLTNANCVMKYFEDNSNNFTFWKKDTIATEKEYFLQINSLISQNLNFHLIDKSLNLNLLLNSEYLKLAGNFQESKFRMDINSNFKIQHFMLEKDTIYTDFACEIEGYIDVDNIDETLILQNIKLINSNVPVFINGTLNYKNDITIDLKAENKKSKLADLIKLLPANISTNFKDFTKKGNAEISLHLQGIFKNKVLPSLKANIIVDNASLSLKKDDIKIEDLNFDLSFYCPNLMHVEISEIKSKKFTAKINNRPMSGDFSIKNFINSNVNLNLIANLNLNDIIKLSKNEFIEKAEGEVEVSLKFSSLINNISKINAKDFLQSKSSGFIKTKNTRIKLKNNSNEILINNLFSEFNDKYLEINNLDVETCNSDFVFSGKIDNFFPFIIVQDQKLNVGGTLKSKKLDTNCFLTANTSTNKKKEEETKFIQFPKFLELDVTTDVKDLVFNTFSAKNLKGNLRLNNQLLLLRNIEMQTMEGRVEADIFLDTRNDKKFDLRVLTNLENVSVSKIFDDFENFGQTSLTSKNLSGKISGTVHASASWDYYFNIDKSSISVVSDLKLEQGNIRNYEPIAGLEGFIKHRNFRDINFETLNNQILIQNQEIIIPVMNIKSSAMNFELSGKHKFNNEIDYNISVLISELRNRRAEVQKPKAEDEYGYIIETDERRNTTWSFKVTGTVDNPKFVPIDLRAVKSNVKQEIKTETVKIRELIINEFKKSNDSSAKIIYHQEGEKPKLFIEWDDE